MKKNILLTGKPGIGKTTAVKCIADKMEPEKIAGFWSQEIREKGRRVGFSIETLSGKTGILAHADQNSGPRVSRYRVNIADIDSVMVPELLAARQSKKIIIIDEIAKMELFSQRFKDEVLRCLDTKRVLGTIQERRIPYLDRIRTRNDVRLIELTLGNRDEVPMRVVKML
jgi:nucleoside-triphosphatase